MNGAIIGITDSARIKLETTVLRGVVYNGLQWSKNVAQGRQKITFTTEHKSSTNNNNRLRVINNDNCVPSTSTRIVHRIVTKAYFKRIFLILLFKAISQKQTRFNCRKQQNRKKRKTKIERKTNKPAETSTHYTAKVGLPKQNARSSSPQNAFDDKLVIYFIIIIVGPCDWELCRRRRRSQSTVFFRLPIS